MDRKLPTARIGVEMNQILTVGYGRDTKEGFQDRLRLLNTSPCVIVDVRKENSGSRNGKWACWDPEGMGATVGEIGVQYVSMPGLANKHGNTREGLLRYEAELLPQGALCEPFNFLKYLIEKGGAAYCLLCAERKPFRRGHVIDRPNCHRVVLAERLLYELNLRSGSEVWWLATHLE